MMQNMQFMLQNMQILHDGSRGTVCRGVGGWEKLPQRAAILRAVPKGRPDRFQEDDFSRTSWCLKIDRSRNSNKAHHGARTYDYRYKYLITIQARPPPETKGSRANELAIGPTVSAEGV